MARKVMLLLAVAAFVGMATAAVALEEETHATAIVEDVGNTVCPVCNTTIEGPDKYTVVSNDKAYSLCCKECEEAFLNDPEKYSEAAEAQAGFVRAPEAAEEKAEQEVEAAPAASEACSAEK